jgi:two-component system, sensor histidine kinase LadS
MDLYKFLLFRKWQFSRIKINLKVIILLLATWLGAQSMVMAQGLQAGQPVQTALQGLAVLEDPQGLLTIEQVRSAQWQARFEPWPAERGQINLGYTDSIYWVRVPMHRQADAPEQWVLELPYFQLRTVDFFAPGHAPVRTGSALPLESRPFQHRFFAFPLAPATETQDHYLRVSGSSHSLSVPLVLWQERAFRANAQNTLVIQFLYFGGLLALCIYNLFLATSLRDARFLLYALFAGVFGMAMLAGNGLGQMFVWPGQGDFDNIAQILFLSLSGAMLMLFSRHFLQAERYTPKISLALKGLALAFFVIAGMLAISVWVTLPVLVLSQIVGGLTLIAGVLIPLAGVKVLRMGQKSTRFFLLAWLVLWTGAMVALLRAYGWLPTNTYTAYSLQISSAFEMLLLALAMADVIHLERRERESAQKSALLAQQRLLEESKSAELRLERAVQERTLQLEAALDAQNQLFKRYVRFGALISHEFRNPLGIVNSQISLLRKEQEKGQVSLDKRLSIMSEATRRLLSLFETWMKGDRLQQAMQELRPQAIPLAAWLRELIDSQTLMHDKHPIDLLLDHPVGEIWADENLLEVALLNLIDNACKYSEPGRPVVIETRSKPGWVGVAVMDQGCGIDAKDHGAIFDDYYRVRPEGAVAGIGLGLALVRRIVQLHQGDLELSSALGQGSCFCLWLPHNAAGPSDLP